MTSLSTTQKQCRICGNSDLITVLDLGTHSLSGRFPSSSEPTPPSAPLVLIKCNDTKDSGPSGPCGLVQLKDTVVADELYFHTYGYRSGINNSMINHLSGLTKEITDRHILSKGDIVLDIGSNDCTLLKSYNFPDAVYIGCDPIGSQFSQYYPPHVTLVNKFFNYQNYVDSVGPIGHIGLTPAKIITSISMFYDLPDPLQFMRDIKRILSPDGLWVTEQSYIVSMLNTCSFDTVCHEHLEYYSLKQMEWMVKQVGLKIIDVSMNECNGGSFRLTITHSDNNRDSINNNAIDKICKIESDAHLDQLETYMNFNRLCDDLRVRLKFLLSTYKENGKSIYLYGASTKGNTLLQYFGLDKSLITATADRNPEKYGHRTPQTNIPIISESEMRLNKPDVLLVLPWHFKTEFIQREDDYLSSGGKMIFPLPNMELVSKKKRALVIGSSGQIGQYLTNKLVQLDYDVYGLVHSTPNPASQAGVLQIHGDINDRKLIDTIVRSIMPHEIYNMASPTVIAETIANPISCYNTNIISLDNLCQSILHFNKKIKLFNMCSSEVYRGHVREDNKEFVFNEQSVMMPVSPYGISKASAMTIIKYYRSQYGLSFYTGILCNVISPKLKDKYLIMKVIRHVKYGGNTLSIGNISINKDFTHASDVVDGIMTIISSTVSPDDYVISSGTPHNIRDIIDLSYLEKGINVTWDKDICSQKDQVLVVSDQSLFRSYEVKGECIVGDPTKLSQLGWKPQYNICSVIHEIYESI